MINRWIVRPFLKATTWIKRNPGLALLLAFLLWIIPSPLTVLVLFSNWWASVLERVSTKARDGFLRATAAFGNWLGARPGRCFWVGFMLMPLNPLGGLALMFWCAIQALKPGITLSIAEREAPIPTEPITTQPIGPADDSDNPFDFGFPS